MLKVFLVEDEVVVREAIRENIPWGEIGYLSVCDDVSEINE